MTRVFTVLGNTLWEFNDQPTDGNGKKLRPLKTKKRDRGEYGTAARKNDDDDDDDEEDEEDERKKRKEAAVKREWVVAELPVSFEAMHLVDEMGRRDRDRDELLSTRREWSRGRRGRAYDTWNGASIEKEEFEAAQILLQMSQGE
ncbi:hypothetical protein HYALB_00013861 [Hymenoscyphus albidus]|uniref:Uncharacterized protein n=1 Tax=Hymenoscyphus albidus TaxID=595503 RepID=A0A9N9QC23_9HELO|nr:hypothetical protein HYALB_00013861 [Hymenoscyphus albidus]